MRVENAADYPELIDTVAKWHWTEWGRDRGESLSSWTAGLKSRTNRDRVPMTFIAIDNAWSPIGSVSVVTHDMPDRADLAHLSPWMAGVFVVSSERGKGVGRMLVRHAAAEAARVGASKLFLYTSTARPFYERLGWTFLRDDFYEGGPVTMMWCAPLHCPDRLRQPLLGP